MKKSQELTAIALGVYLVASVANCKIYTDSERVIATQSYIMKKYEYSIPALKNSTAQFSKLKDQARNNPLYYPFAWAYDLFTPANKKY